MTLWIVETNGGTRFVVYAHDAKSAVSFVAASDRDRVRAVREWPKDAPFRVAFEPVTAIAEDAVMQCGWDCVADWGDEPPPATAAALGDLHEALRERAELDERLKADHDRGAHIPDALDECPTCFEDRIAEAVERQSERRLKYDA